jgi:hypothetical protein
VTIRPALLLIQSFASSSGYRIKGLAIVAQGKRVAIAQATDNSVSQAGVATACSVHLVRKRQVTHQQCSLIAIIREAKCHPV